MKIRLIIIVVILFFWGCEQKSNFSQLELGKMRVGFDVDDTIVFSKFTFEHEKAVDNDGRTDFGWVNQHDRDYSTIIKPIKQLIYFLRNQGHEIYFVTSRPGENGQFLADFISDSLGFLIRKDIELFFSPKMKDPISSKRFTTKHKIMEKLKLNLYYGDSDTDMIAATIAGIRGVRVVRDPQSIESYSSNYFGDLKMAQQKGGMITPEIYKDFLRVGVGPYGETIYPIFRPE